MNSCKKGLTLIELLIALSLFSVVMLLGYSVYITSIKNFDRDVASIDNQANVRFAMGYITRELRKASEIEVEGNQLTINKVDRYYFSNGILRKNYNQLVTGISSFEVTLHENKLTIKITSIPDKNGNNVELASAIYLRNR